MNGLDAIVIGIGGMGSAALWHLARRGLKVLGLEQFGLAHDRGSSHGESRLIRRVHYEHPGYVPLAARAFDLWAEVEWLAKATLFVRTGFLLAGREDRPIISGVRRVARTANFSISELSIDECARQFPGFTPAGDMTALYEPEAGYLRVEECIRAFVGLAQADGATVRYNEPAIAWGHERDSVWVQTNHERYHASKLLFCGGAWTGQLLHALGLPLNIRRKVVLWYEAREGVYADASGCPIAGFDTEAGFQFAFPTLDGATVKVVEHSGGIDVPSIDELDRSLNSDDQRPMLQFIRNRLPFATENLVRYSVCPYTMTPDEHFIIDRHPLYSNVLIPCGFSGHGYKFASVVGKALADLAADGRTDEPIGFLRLDRLLRSH